MKKTTKKEVKPQVEQYKARVKILGKFYEATGDTAIEAISNLKPDSSKGVCILTVSKGDLVKEKMIPSFQTARLFSGSRVMREVGLKNVASLFNI